MRISFHWGLNFNEAKVFVDDKVFNDDKVFIEDKVFNDDKVFIED